MRRPRWLQWQQHLSTTSTRPSRSPSVTLARHLWVQLLAELQRRGAGERESGAFLLARRIPTEGPAAHEVIAIAYYDDIDAHCLTGGITMAGTAYDALWSRCRTEGLRVVADAHTHPGGVVTQSAIDRANPMMANAGHVALIIGHYANSSAGEPPVGMYRYLGNRSWQELDVRDHLYLHEDPARRDWWKPWHRRRIPSA